MKPLSFSRALLLQNRGISIVEVLVVGGIMAIMMFAMMSVIQTQQVEVRSLQQKTEAVELKALLLKSFSDASVCTWQFQNKVVNVTPGASVTPLSVPALYQGLNAGSPALAIEGDKLPSSSYGLRVERISLGSFTPTGIANEYQGTLEVSFQSGSMARSMKPVQIRQIVKTDPSDPPVAKKILSCASSSGTGLACVYGSLTGKTNQKKIITSAGYTPANFDEVFNTIPGASNINGWGLACQTGWILTGCMINSSGAVSSSGYAPTVTQDWDVRMGSDGFCKSDSEEYDADAELIGICCRSGS